MAKIKDEKKALPKRGSASDSPTRGTRAPSPRKTTPSVKSVAAGAASPFRVTKSPMKRTSPSKANEEPSSSGKSKTTKMAIPSDSKVSKPVRQFRSQSLLRSLPPRPERGLLREETTSSYKPTEPLEYILAGLNKTRLTKVDKDILIPGIKALEKSHAEAEMMTRFVRELRFKEATKARQGEVLNCDYQLYWHFRKLYEKLSGRFLYPSPKKGKGQSSVNEIVLESIESAETPQGVKQRAHGSDATSRQATRSPNKLFPAPDLSPGKSRSRQPSSEIPASGSSPRRPIPSANTGASPKLEYSQKMLRKQGTQAEQSIRQLGVTLPGSELTFSPSPSSHKTKKTQTNLKRSHSTKSPSPKKVSASSSKSQRAQSPKKSTTTAVANLTQYREFHDRVGEHKESRGTIFPSIQQQHIHVRIPGKSARETRNNPFFETMPGPEVWHRNMPSFFTFGKVVSDGINKDLGRVRPSTSSSKPVTRPTTTLAATRTSIPETISEILNTVTLGVLGSPGRSSAAVPSLSRTQSEFDGDVEMMDASDDGSASDQSDGEEVIEHSSRFPESVALKREVTAGERKRMC